MRAMPYYVYILSSRSRNLYVGVTNNITRRVAEHRQELVPGFTKRYRIHRLVHVEPFRNILAAIAREKQIKGWLRAKKIALIEEQNPGWDDLAAGWFPEPKYKSKTSADPSSPVLPQERAGRSGSSG